MKKEYIPQFQNEIKELNNNRYKEIKYKIDYNDTKQDVLNEINKNIKKANTKLSIITFAILILLLITIITIIFKLGMLGALSDLNNYYI